MPAYQLTIKIGIVANMGEPTMPFAAAFFRNFIIEPELFSTTVLK